MFCPRCGKELPEDARFCDICGIALQKPLSKNMKNPSRTLLKGRKKELKWWQILVIAGGGVLAFGVLFVVVLFNSDRTRMDNRETMPTGNQVAQKGENEVLNGQYEQNGEMEENFENNIAYSFVKNPNNFYFISPNHSEAAFLVTITDWTDTSIKLKVYSHSLGLYGQNQYNAYTETFDLTYNGENSCYEFEFGGYWRIYPDRIEFGHYHTHYGQKEYEVLEPVDLRDYWWYEVAKREAGDYEINNAVELNKAEINDVIIFGKYEMDNDTSNGAENIAWRVIDKNNNGILVLSKYCLFCQQSLDIYSDWENSPTRTVLNEEFLNTSFSDDEKAKIIPINIPDGNNVTDKVFILSVSEIEKYLPEKKDRIAYGTLSVEKQMEGGTWALDWWLRTPGKTKKYEACIKSNGDIQDEFVETGNIGIRPAMWISFK